MEMYTYVYAYIVNMCIETRVCTIMNIDGGIP